MKTKQSSLELRRKMKAKKPKFRNQGSHVKKKVQSSWRWPRGWQAKARLRIKGHIKMPKQGYRSPVAVRNLTRDGFQPIMVNNINDLSKINKEQKGIISSKVGNRKRVEIINIAKQKGIKLNLNIEKTLQKIDADLKQRKEINQKTTKKKEENKKEREKKAEKKEKNLDQKVEQTPEEKQKQEKKEKDKMLTTTD